MNETGAAAIPPEENKIVHIDPRADRIRDQQESIAKNWQLDFSQAEKQPGISMTELARRKGTENPAEKSLDQFKDLLTGVRVTVTSPEGSYEGTIKKLGTFGLEIENNGGQVTEVDLPHPKLFAIETADFATAKEQGQPIRLRFSGFRNLELTVYAPAELLAEFIKKNYPNYNYYA